MLEVLYEDRHIIVCIKPIGVLSQSDSSQETDMTEEIRTYLKGKGEQPYVGCVHRLDRNVGGVMLFSKQPSITGKLSAAIQERRITKEYMAVVHNVPEEARATFKDLLFKDSSKNKTFVVARQRKGVKEASLEYQLLSSSKTEQGECSLVRVKLHTGRTHQIRVQFSSRGMPLLGDGKYGSKDNRCEIALWSYRLAFQHPITKKAIDVEKLPPSQYPFHLFELQ